VAGRIRRPARAEAVRDRGRAVIFSARVGAGHDAAADEIARRLAGAGLVVDRYDFLDQMPGIAGRLICGSYHSMLLAAPWSYRMLYGALDRSSGLSLQVTCFSALSTRRMLEAIGPDARVVVSTYPLASQVLGRMRRGGRLRAPVVTYLTDYSVHRLWVAEGVDGHTAVHDVAAGQARALGAAQVVTVDPAVNPRFARRTEDSRTRARAKFGLPAEGRLALLVGGSWGIGEFDESVRDVLATGVARCVVVCGQNEDLRRRLSEQGVEHVFGWVDDMPGLNEAGTARWVRDAADLRAALEKALLETSWDELPEFAADPVTVILGMAPLRTPEGQGLARVPKQRDRKNRRWERRLRGARPGAAASDGNEYDEYDWTRGAA
jgi:UDP-N-acetylglucosamine:LPS N-acetylglucosamine transferase